jgi:hypothetical protein
MMFSDLLQGTMDAINCKEMFAEFYVGPTAARRNVPQGYELLVHKNGKAMLLIFAQDSQKCILNGLIPVSPMRMTQIWIELVGPDEIGPPLPGTAGSLPSRYWYTLPHQMDSTRAHVAFRFMEFDTQRVKGITLGGEPGGTLAALYGVIFGGFPFVYWTNVVIMAAFAVAFSLSSHAVCTKE